MCNAPASELLAEGRGPEAGRLVRGSVLVPVQRAQRPRSSRAIADGYGVMARYEVVGE